MKNTKKKFSFRQPKIFYHKCNNTDMNSAALFKFRIRKHGCVCVCVCATISSLGLFCFISFLADAFDLNLNFAIASLWLCCIHFVTCYVRLMKYTFSILCWNTYFRLFDNNINLFPHPMKLLIFVLFLNITIEIR